MRPDSPGFCGPGHPGFRRDGSEGRHPRHPVYRPEGVGIVQHWLGIRIEDPLDEDHGAALSEVLAEEFKLRPIGIAFVYRTGAGISIPTVLFQVTKLRTCMSVL
jgi:hypothetical protein